MARSGSMGLIELVKAKILLEYNHLNTLFFSNQALTLWGRAYFKTQVLFWDLIGNLAGVHVCVWV